MSAHAISCKGHKMEAVATCGTQRRNLCTEHRFSETRRANGNGLKRRSDQTDGREKKIIASYTSLFQTKAA